MKEVDSSENEDFDSATESSDSNNSDFDSTDRLADEFQSQVRLDYDNYAEFYAHQMANRRTRKDWFVSHCLLKQTSRVEHMLQRYEDQFFKDRDQYGNDIMTLVAIEGHVCIMQLLYNAGAGILNVNARGRTPLMEAALWGRDDAVKFLVGKGADPHLKDHKNRTVLDLARETD